VKRSDEVIVYGHSNLFYWWPVWLLGFALSFATWHDGNRAVIVPEDFISIKKGPNGEVIAETPKGVAPVPGKLERVSRSGNQGILFAITLLIVVIITNVPLRGWASALTIVIVLLMVVVFAWQGWWDQIGQWFNLLSLHVNMGFYLFLSTSLFIVWLLVFLVFDRLSYWRVTPGAITHEYLFGGKETAFTSQGMAVSHLRDDPFRHWILGGGAGDLVMHPAQRGAAQADELTIRNVLFVGNKVTRITKLIAETTAVQG
jgi:hypothetical protein